MFFYIEKKILHEKVLKKSPKNYVMKVKDFVKLMV